MGNSKAFPTVLSLGTALVFFAFIGTALAAPDNSWQGTASDNVKVYVDPSATSRVVTILTRGVHVNVLVEIEALGIQWCRVQVPSESEPLGYARCTDIQRPASQIDKAVHKQPIATPAAAVSAPVVLERRPEQPSASTTGGSITSVAPMSVASTDALTNTDIISMTKAGLPPDVLVAKIKSSKSQFDTSPASLSQLKSSGVADGVILAMVQAPTGGTTTATAAAQPAAVVPTAPSSSPPSAVFGRTGSDGECVILKRMGPADQVTSHMYSFGIRGKQFQYVEGQFPSGVTFHGRLTDNDVRNVQKKGGHVVIMEPKYSADDLREAKQSCKEQ